MSPYPIQTSQVQSSTPPPPSSIYFMMHLNLLYFHFIRLFLILGCVRAAVASVIPAKRATLVQVSGNGTTYTGTQVNNQDVFLGIPYAQPPVGNLRFRKPLPATPGSAVEAQTYGPRCLQYLPANDTSEDCLTLNIWRPRGLTGPVPVMLWIYGGSFILGESQTYPGAGLVAVGVSTGKPVIYVNFNYRLGFFGFPVGKQAMQRGATNLGLYDQRLAIEWVQNNIRYFGGDPTKVTLFGESAGAICVSYQLLYRAGQIKNAFRAAIMESGAPSSYKATAQNSTLRQQTYDLIASQTGCNAVADSFECLRALDVNKLQAVHVATYVLPPDLVAYANFPATYGPATVPGDDFLPAASSTLVKAGKYANIPIISGTNLDEGTWFVANPNTSSDIVSFLAQSRPGLAFSLSPSATTPLLAFYPDELALGSPYGTGNETFGRAREYKRAASIVGDLIFTAARRLFIGSSVSRNQNVWSYLFTQQLGGPTAYGVFHSSEIPYVYGGLPADATAGDAQLSSYMMQYWINFANTLNPRPAGSNLPAWPTYGTAKNMLQFKANNYTIVSDTYREAASTFIAGNPQLLN